MLPRKLKRVLRQEFWVPFETLLVQGTEVGPTPSLCTEPCGLSPCMPGILRQGSDAYFFIGPSTLLSQTLCTKICAFLMDWGHEQSMTCFFSAAEMLYSPDLQVHLRVRRD